MTPAADKEGVGSTTGFRLVALIAIALASLWLSLAVTTGLVYAPRDPTVSIPGWHSATAEAEAAVAILQQGQQASDLNRVAAMARRALMRDPLNVVAARALGAVAAFREQQKAARGWFEYAQWLSRRDLPTQLWLIEDAVSRGQIELALRHYNIALKTNSSAEQLLFPILVSASADPAITQPLAALLRKKPLWWGSFIDALVADGPSPDGLVTLVNATQLNLRYGPERRFAARAIQRLFRLGAMPEAFALYQLIAKGRGEIVQNGSFQHANPLPPIDWELTNEPDLFAAIAVGPDDHHPRALELRASNGRGGVAAQQVLNLKPGRYLLSALVGSGQTDVAEQPRMRISCRSNAGKYFVNLPFSTSEGEAGAQIATEFDVPESDCAFQWLRIYLPGPINSRTTAAWITDVTLQPR